MAGKPPPIQVRPSKPAKKRKEKTPAEAARRAEAIARERRRIRDLGAESRESAKRSVLVSTEKERLTQAGFRQRWAEYNDIYQAYAGRDASRGEALALINSGVTFTSLARYLATKPAFFKSPIWQQKSDAYFGVAKTMGMKVDRKFIAKAIANNWDEANFSEKLRKSPGYLKSNEFKTTTAGFTNAYRSMYGDPDPEWQKEIQRVALGRWTPDQWLKKLRDDPKYKTSSEYQTKLTDFKSLLGY